MQKQTYQGMKTDGRGCEEGLRQNKQEVQSAADDDAAAEGWIKSKQGDARRGATQIIEKYDESEGERGGNRFQRRKRKKFTDEQVKKHVTHCGVF